MNVVRITKMWNRDNAVVHWRDYSVKINLCNALGNKFTWVALLQYLLYCSGLELKSEYPQGYASTKESSTKILCI